MLLITGGVKSWSVVAALQEAGLELVGTSVKKSTKEDKERIKELMGQDAHMIDDMTPREMYKMLKEARGGHHALGRPFAIHRAEGRRCLGSTSTRNAITPTWAMSAW